MTKEELLKYEEEKKRSRALNKLAKDIHAGLWTIRHLDLTANRTVREENAICKVYNECANIVNEYRRIYKLTGARYILQEHRDEEVEKSVDIFIAGKVLREKEIMERRAKFNKARKGM